MTTLFNVSRTGAVRYWSISIDKHILTIEYGQEGTNQPITTTYVGKLKNAGKANEITAEDDALNEMERLILSKERKGYRPGRSLIENTNDVDFDNIPVNLRFYKPQSKITKQAEDMIVNGNPIVTRKYNGEMMVVVCNNGEVQIFSRTMLPNHHREEGIPWTDRFPHLVNAFSNVTGKHIFTGEVVYDNAPGAKDGRWLVATVLKSKTEKAIREQMENKLLDYVIWDWPVKDGSKNLDTYGHRLKDIYTLCNSGDLCRYACVSPPSVLYNGTGKKLSTTPEKFVKQYKESAELLGYEGFILADGDDNYADKLYNFRGKTDRPKTFCKIKPIYEDDFVAYWDPEAGDGTYGRGKAEGLLGSVALYQLDKDGELVYICDCGGGFSDAFRKEVRKEDFPLVMEVMYESRTYTSKGANTNALEFPRMVRTRHDKAIEECINEQL